jgi:hypothetical protein
LRDTGETKNFGAQAPQRFKEITNMGDNLIGVGTNQSGKRGGDAAGGLALSAGIGAGSGSGEGGTGLLGSSVGVGVGTGVGVGGTADASAAGGDASDNSYIGSITINA